MITIDQEVFEEAKKELEGIYHDAIPALNVVTANFINSCISKVKKATVDEIIDRYYINKKPVRDAIKVDKATPNYLEARVLNNRKQNKDRFTLARFKVVVPETGPIKVAQSKSGGLNELKRAWLMDGRSVGKTGKTIQVGNTQVFRRKGKSREPFNLERSYSIGGMVGAANLEGFIEERAEDYINDGFEDEINKYLDKLD